MTQHTVNSTEWLEHTRLVNAARQRRFMQRRKEWLDSLKAKPCADCGGEFPPYCMDWHHEGDKDYGIGHAYSKGWSRARILKEIAKCVLLCAICHRRRHYA